MLAMGLFTFPFGCQFNSRFGDGNSLLELVSRSEDFEVIAEFD